MHKTLFLFSLFISKIFWVEPLLAADFHVRAGGSSWPCGSVATPCGLISDVISSSFASDANIKVAMGSYQDSFNVYASLFDSITISGGWNAGFTSQRCQANSTTFVPVASGYTIMRFDALLASENVSVDIACLTLRGAADTHTDAVVFVANGGSVIFDISSVAIEQIAGSGLDLYSANAGSISGAIHKSVFRSSYQPATVPPSKGGGIASAAWGGSQQTLAMDNCLLVNNEAIRGSAIDQKTSGVGTTSSITLTNVTLANNRSIGPGLGGAIYVESDDSGQGTHNLKNTSLWGNSNAGTARDLYLYQSASGNTTVNASYSNVGPRYHSGGSGTYNDNGHNLDIDPKLDSRYHLNPNSPMIDQAQCGLKFITYKRVAPYDDIDNENRPGFGVLRGCDIGADEYHDDTMCVPVRAKNGKVAVFCL